MLEYVGGGRFEKRRILAKDIPIHVFFYCILKDNETHLQTNAQISIDTLFEEMNQVGKYMNLSYTTLLELLQQIENRKWISIVNNFGSRYIEIKRNDAAELFVEYYREVEE